jgi:hypothetical protein
MDGMQMDCIARATYTHTHTFVDHIAIDGKTACGSTGSKLGPLHLVSAWATQAQVALGQVAVDGKSNEITAIPQLLALLDLHGALVTIDAMGCQKAIAQQIVAGGGDYVLVVKGNQERLLEDIQQTVAQALDGKLPEGVVRQCLTTDRGHGPPKTGLHRSPTASTRFGIVRMVNVPESNPCFTSIHFRGAETVAPGRAAVRRRP